MLSSESWWIAALRPTSSPRSWRRRLYPIGRLDDPAGWLRREGKQMFPQIWPVLFAQTARWPTNWLEGFDAGQRFSLVVVCIVFAAGIIVASIAIIGGL